ncbi:MAG: non-hydrolyzing UDP-N-acetylglucosamine 2-epimerase [Planctomycetota bacterium]
MRILNVVGARPNFMKMAPLVRVLQERGIEQKLLHTGQHYDDNMSKVFFEDLRMPQPDIYLGVGSGSHAEQTARIMVEFEKICLAEKPDLVVVVGDVNSTLACSIVASKLWIPVAHVEAGLRSFDWRMPEEINRVVTDRLAEILLTPSPDGDENLLKEGTDPARIHRVGNIMIDSLVANLERAESSRVLDELGLSPGSFGVLTLHRPSNVDDPQTLLSIMGALHRISRRLPIVFSCHPRSAERLRASPDYEALATEGDVRILEPLGYLDFLRLYSRSRLVLTDSGGLQEETTFLKIPCVTIRENTERPITLTEGTNTLAGCDPARIEAAADAALNGRVETERVPDLWDGRTAPRIMGVFEAWWESKSGSS